MARDSTDEKSLLMNMYDRYLHGERDFSENELLQLVQHSGLAIRFIDNPSKEIQLEAIKRNKFAIYFIKNPSFKFLKEKFKGTELEKFIDKEIMIQSCI